MVKSPQRIWIEADEECPYFYEAHELHDVEQDVIEYVRADLHAALEAKLADLAAENERLKQEIAATQEKLIRANDELIQRNSKALSRTGAGKVKPLVWEYHPAGLVASAGGIDEAYIIDTRIARRVYFLKGMDPNRAYTSVEAAKAAAQADYERRILAALEPAESSPAAEPVAWVAADTLNSPHPGCVSSLAYVSQIDKDQGREYVPLYTHPTPSEARLREAAREAVNCITHHAEDNENTRWVLSLLNAALEECQR